MEAYITLLTNNNYASGALVLGYSLRAAQTKKSLAILITANVSRQIRDRLAEVYDSIIEIGEIDSHSTKNLELLGRPELGITLTKIHVFNQTQYSKLVFLDADTLVLRNIDELFDTAANGSIDDEDRNTRFAAAPDAGWPDCFNSGVFVCKPKYEDYTGLIEMSGTQGTFDGGDQGLLNSYFGGWSRGHPNNRLPFVYNTTPTSVYSYAPAFEQFKDRLAVIHFVGSFKPWQWLRFADGQVFPRNTSSTDSIALVQRWWSVFDKFVGGKPSDIHEVVHGYDMPPMSQWDHVGLDGQVHESEPEKGPHYDGWFQPYTHQNQTYPSPHEHHHHQEHQQEHHHHHQEHHHQEHHHQEHHHQEHHNHEHHNQEHHNHEHHHQEHNQHHEQQEHHGHHHHEGHQEQHHEHRQEHGHEHHQEKREEEWRPPIPPLVPERNWQHEHHGWNQHQENGGAHHQLESQYSHNPHHLTDYHYQPPPPPPKVPEIPEPQHHHYDHGQTNGGQDSHHHHHHHNHHAEQEINPHHLTDYRYRLPTSADSSESTGGVSAFGRIIPEPIGLPDMYYPNAWDLPEDPRKKHPIMIPVPLEIVDTTDADSPSTPSGKGRPIFPWELSGPNTPKSPRTPSRIYYNYSATIEEQRREMELEESKRREAEEVTMKKIRSEEKERYERERQREMEHEKNTGGQAFENFRLVNAWDVDVGVQMSILQKTEKRKPRSRKSSAGGIRKGYGLEDMIAYEARRRQEQYEAELVRKRLEEEEQWVREQEEARVKEEELRLEKIRLAKLARIKAEQIQKKQEESSRYVFRNAWDPPNSSLTKKKLRIEDEEVELALPLRQDRRRTQSFSRANQSWPVSGGDLSTEISTVERAGCGGVSVAAAAAGAAGVAIAASSRYGSVARSREDTAQGVEIDSVQRETRSRSDKVDKSSLQRLSAAGEEVRSSAMNKSTVTTVQKNQGVVEGKSSISTEAKSGSSSTSTLSLTKITPPGAQRFVKTTVTTTITRQKFKNGAEISSSTESGTVSGEKRFDIPPGPRSGSYFGEESRKTVTMRSTSETSRLGSGLQSSSVQSDQRAGTSSMRSIEGGSTSSTSHMQQSLGSEALERVSKLSSIEGKRTSATTTSETSTTTTRGSSSKTGESLITSAYESSERASSKQAEIRKQGGLGLLIDTKGSSTGYTEEDDVLERESELRQHYASEAAAEEAIQVLSKYPQATSRYGKRTVSGSSTGSTGNQSTTNLLYASELHMPRQYTESYSSFSGKGKRGKARSEQASESFEGEEETIYQGEDQEELEYFGKMSTRTGGLLGSPFMPSTPMTGSTHRYGATASDHSSRASSRPSTPGSGTPSRFGPGTPKVHSKRTSELKSGTITPTTSSVQQTAPIDSGFTNYKIEWNWKELLGKRPRQWTAEAGEERYDPFNADFFWLQAGADKGS
ncbi:hypothetical protein BGZ76_010686 [Entomortierella beljakovae]|nr:hypothetical protein BGZ76_010686 [Entomortierella beljakovae]